MGHRRAAVIARPRARTRRWAALVALVGFGGLVLAAADRSAAESARFEVRPDAIAPEPPAVSATFGGFGNGGSGNGNRFAQHAGFEPWVFRTQFLATGGDATSILAPDSDLSQWGTLRAGALDGAEARVYRIENGAFRLIRTARVAQGGHEVVDWAPLRGGRWVLPPDTREVPLVWERWYRPDADTWFALRAVDKDGRVSPMSEPVRAVSPGAAARPTWRDADPFDAFKERYARFGANIEDRRAGFGPPRDVALVNAGAGRQALRWSAPEGGTPAGYVLYRATAPSPPEARSRLLLEGDGHAVQAGDLVILSHRFVEVTRADYVADRVWDAVPGRRMRPGPLDFWPDPSRGIDWSLVRHAPDTAVEEAGETYLSITQAQRGTVSLRGGYHGGLDEGWYEVLEPTRYVMEAWVRSAAPTTAQFRLHGVYADSVPAAQFNVGPEWRKISTEITIPRVKESGRGSFRLDLSGQGRIDVDNFRIFRADADFLDLLPEDYALLERSGVSALRTHSLIKTGTATYDLEQLTNPGGVASGPMGGATLPQQLGPIEKAGMDAWIQVEPHLSPEEWAGLVEYLAAPPGKSRPWANKRAAQGHPAPWTDVFPRIHFEIGNETWNGLFRPWVYPDMTDAATGERYRRGEVYGLYQQYVIEQLKASPWWAEAGLDDKVQFMLGGWIANDYGQKAAMRSPDSGFVGIAPYIGGWDAGEGLPGDSPEDYFNLLNWVSRSTVPFARRHMEWAEGLTGPDGAPIEVGTYEGGPGFVLKVRGKGLSPEQASVQERVMKSKAAGIATLDSTLAMAEAGFGLQNFFNFGVGERWASHAEWQNGGQAYPGWLATALYNREGRGEMLEVRTLEAPRTDLAKTARREAVSDAPLIKVYATRGEDRLNLFVISRRLPAWPDPQDDGCTPVEIALPFASSRSLTLHRMTGAYDADNVDADRVQVTTETLPPPADVRSFVLSEAVGAQACGLPAASALLYVFEGLEKTD